MALRKLPNPEVKRESRKGGGREKVYRTDKCFRSSTKRKNRNLLHNPETENHI